ncbi:YidC/Oxa1 family membrane protein insertase [Caldicellulosiruptor bescii]|uniref:60 kDa inner membrane insertion protein n=2 Tax=Caldicellulosiruptor bescii TaxID=31899 RepID=B9MQF5_CALBD|nr:YidC/Oxa1 family membrane protein insertase [Caldicellulosiruptor bescii]ACM61812.1 60 kDa inner membrane insertion protein [Caldicellulosiruptor bescii DSM 6725]PBC88389.1 YidC/Oxa1 family membrane protein insertase [Caldicellulosiruptor bescii]PBC92130.1 YidC/Oxa1 family membrane protein insertase [Caldicellulosiruptor bescii]PBD05060.1 YidC/Oxa1 family membrane protein insertase [Caldicellulosiruptor bescii]PBD05309.1 YidC/Oxa1 family membrane protein insertase [Caldicellulosiruptor besc
MNPTWLDFLAIPLGRLLKFIYDFLHGAHIPGSYGIAIILLTLIVRGLLLPLYIKQIQSTSKMAEVAPRLQEIQQKYKNDQKKMQEEMLKLYQETGYNPAGGCWPLLIQIPILFSLYYVFQNPLVYVLGKSHQYVKDLITGATGYNITQRIVNEAQKLGLDMHFFGINLAQKELIVLPILSAVFSFLSILYSMNSQKKFNPQYSSSQTNAMAEGMNRSLMIFSPLMSYFIALQVPSGLVLYWTVSNLFQILQQFIANEVVYKKLKHKKEEEERKKQLEKQAQKMQEVEVKEERIENEDESETAKGKHENSQEDEQERIRKKELEKLKQQISGQHRTSKKKKK